MFYGYTRSVIPFIIEKAMTDTRKVAPWMKLAVQGDTSTHLPPWVRDGLSIPIGEDEGGQKEFLRGLSTPFEAAVEPFSGAAEFQQGIGAGVSGLANSLLGGLAPPLKAPIEAATGQDLFFRQPIEDLDKAPDFLRFLPKTVKDALGINDIVNAQGQRVKTTADPWALYALRNSPASRFIGTAGKLAGFDKKDIGPIVANLLTGAQTTTIDPEFQRRQAQRDAAIQQLKLLERQGRVRSTERFFRPKAVRETGQDPQADALLQLLSGRGNQQNREQQRLTALGGLEGLLSGANR